MYDLLPRQNANSSRAERARALHQLRHHAAMRPQQILNGVGGQRGGKLVGGYGIPDFLHITRRSHHTLAIQDVRHLLQRKRVAFDGQRGMMVLMRLAWRSLRASRCSRRMT